MDDLGKLYQFINCKILRNHKIINEDIWVRNGKIVDPEKVFFDEKIRANEKIDCGNKLIAPGFIELQINGGYSYDFSFEDNTEEGLAVVSKKLLEHGVTAFCPTMVTSPVQVYHKVLPKLAPKKGGLHGATILGVHVEGPFINEDKKGAHPSACILNCDQGGISQIIDTYGSLENIKIITLAPEFIHSSTVIQDLRNKNLVVSIGHSTANLDQSEDAFLNGANLITHLFNAMLPFHHRDPGLVGLLASDKVSEEQQIYFGLIADGIHTHPAALRIAHRIHPNGLILVTDAISALGLQSGKHKIGQLNIEIRENKAFIAGTTTLCGSIAPMIECVQNFMDATNCSPEYALETASLHPAKVLGIEKSKGTLDYGADADFIMLNENFDVVSTWIHGECVYKNNKIDNNNYG